MTLPTRVLVVDDGPRECDFLRHVIEQQPDMECVGVTTDPQIAHELIRALKPDVVTLSAAMRGMEQVEALTRLVLISPMPVIVVTPPTERAARVALRALEMGAIDCVVGFKPAEPLDQARFAGEIVDKIRIAARAQARRPARSTCGTAPFPPRRPAGLGGMCDEKLIFVGAAVGGILATRTLLENLPPDAPAVLLALHVSAGLTRDYVAWLDRACRMTVKEVVDGEPVLPGKIHVAPDGMHLMVERAGDACVARLHLSHAATGDALPVAALFSSAARVVGPDALGVMLTGQGSDGADAMKQMYDAGAWNVAQDAASCVVFDMPGHAIAANAIHQVRPLDAIAATLIDHLRSVARVPGHA